MNNSRLLSVFLISSALAASLASGCANNAVVAAQPVQGAATRLAPNLPVWTADPAEVKTLGPAQATDPFKFQIPGGWSGPTIGKNEDGTPIYIWNGPSHAAGVPAGMSIRAYRTDNPPTAFAKVAALMQVDGQLFDSTETGRGSGYVRTPLAFGNVNGMIVGRSYYKINYVGPDGKPYSAHGLLYIYRSELGRADVSGGDVEPTSTQTLPQLEAMCLSAQGVAK
jgi:hypothetical protein